MAYCVNCGQKVDDNVKYCPECGAEMPAFEGKQEQNDRPYQEYSEPGYAEACFDPNDVRANKAMGILSYIGILVLIPLLAGNKSSEYVRFHLNQGLVFFIVNIIVELVFGGSFFGFYLPFAFHFWLIDFIGVVLDLILFVFMIMGIVNAAKGRKKELPIIGGLRIMK